MTRRVKLLLCLGILVPVVTGCTPHGTAGGAAGATGASGAAGAGAGQPQAGEVRGHLYGTGGISPGSPRPWDGTVTVTGAGFRREILVGADGAFALSLAPGRYLLTGRSPHFGGGRYPCNASQPADIRAGRTISVDVLCSMR